MIFIIKGRGVVINRSITLKCIIFHYRCIWLKTGHNNGFIVCSLVRIKLLVTKWSIYEISTRNKEINSQIEKWNSWRLQRDITIQTRHKSWSTFRWWFKYKVPASCMEHPPTLPLITSFWKTITVVWRSVNAPFGPTATQQYSENPDTM